MIRDVITEAWDQKQERKRLRASPDTAFLRSLVQAGEDRWLRLVAIGHFRAEQERSGQTRLDASKALQKFDSNPFRWGASADKQSHAQVTFLWSWQEAPLPRHTAFVSSRLDNVFQRNRVLPPPGMCKINERRYQQLAAHLSSD